jgi:trans-aconitate methyltransferase
MLPRLDGFFTVFIMSIIMFGTGKSSVATMIRWIDQPCLVPFLPCVASPDREAFRAEVIERMVHATRHPDGRCFELFRRVHVFFRG